MTSFYFLTLLLLLKKQILQFADIEQISKLSVELYF